MSDVRRGGVESLVWHRARCVVCGDPPDEDGAEWRATRGEALAVARTPHICAKDRR